jgi:hypothetical protein
MPGKKDLQQKELAKLEQQLKKAKQEQQIIRSKVRALGDEIASDSTGLDRPRGGSFDGFNVSDDTGTEVWQQEVNELKIHYADNQGALPGLDDKHYVACAAAHLLHVLNTEYDHKPTVVKNAYLALQLAKAEYPDYGRRRGTGASWLDKQVRDIESWVDSRIKVGAEAAALNRLEQGLRKHTGQKRFGSLMSKREPAKHQVLKAALAAYKASLTETEKASLGAAEPDDVETIETEPNDLENIKGQNPEYKERDWRDGDSQTKAAVDAMEQVINDKKRTPR